MLINVRTKEKETGDYFKAYNANGILLGYYSWYNSPGLWQDKAIWYPHFVWEEVDDTTTNSH